MQRKKRNKKSTKKSYILCTGITSTWDKFERAAEACVFESSSLTIYITLVLTFIDKTSEKNG